jgi:hypothetical protein
MSDEHEHDHPHEDEALDLELDTQSRIFLQMRAQNLDLLKVAAQVAGYSGHGPGHPMKPGDLRNAMKTIWDIYAEFYSWIDPEESGDDDEGDDE